MRLMPAISLCGALVLHSAACSSSGSMTPADGGASDQGGIVLPPGTPVNGTDTTTNVLDSGPSVVPNDLTTNIIAALVPNVLGGFTTIAGKGNTDGTFTIPNVPMGTYYLQYGFPSFPYNYVVTSAHQLDFGSDSLGRPDVNYASGTTTYSPMLSGLSPWGAKITSRCCHPTRPPIATAWMTQPTPRRPQPLP